MLTGSHYGFHGVRHLLSLQQRANCLQSMHATAWYTSPCAHSIAVQSFRLQTFCKTALESLTQNGHTSVTQSLWHDKLSLQRERSNRIVVQPKTDPPK